MKLYGKSSLSEFLGDRVVYRNLDPAEARLPGLDEVRKKIDLEAGFIPRKHEVEYARVVAYLLRQAHALDAPGIPIRRLIFIGDTRLLDITAFSNICQAGGWPGVAFIGSETKEAPSVQIEQIVADRWLYLSNRWGALDSTYSGMRGIQSFEEFCSEKGFAVDHGTALLIDMDKTAIGARGRNSSIIDQVRVQAAIATVAGVLGESFNLEGFMAAYQPLNQPEYHYFTEDNQDNLVYICLVVGSGLIGISGLKEQLHDGRVKSFRQFIDRVDQQKSSLPVGLQVLHDQIYSNVQAGDPTPFKSFRYNEYRLMMESMCVLEDGAPLERMLNEEVVITQEVRGLAKRWQERGVLTFGLSDKPDEASVPTEELRLLGLQPLHRTKTHVVGEMM